MLIPWYPVVQFPFLVLVGGRVTVLCIARGTLVEKLLGLKEGLSLALTDGESVGFAVDAAFGSLLLVLTDGLSVGFGVDAAFGTPAGENVDSLEGCAQVFSAQPGAAFSLSTTRLVSSKA
jgi:hypothetical protein